FSEGNEVGEVDDHPTCCAHSNRWNCGPRERRSQKEVPWKAPLLILDEAHHARNDTTRLAKLFRKTSESDIAFLSGKFRRMLLLTATPFQLGHHELIQVLRTFTSVFWDGDRAPCGTSFNVGPNWICASRVAATKNSFRRWSSIQLRV
ncbi:MAG: hypothetical protein ACK6EB_01875, partial [Planctomyces sp.]